MTTKDGYCSAHVEMHGDCYDAELSESELIGLLAVFDSLTMPEKCAFIAWFAGGNSYVTKYATQKHVFFGKAECELVDFDEFWLKKLPALGFIEVKEEKRFKAIGMIGQPEAIKYQLLCTEKGHDIKDAYWARTKAKNHG